MPAKKEYSKPDGRTAGEREEASTAPLASALPQVFAAADDSANVKWQVELLRARAVARPPRQSYPRVCLPHMHARRPLSQVWNKVELARKLQGSFKDFFYPPKFLLHILKMQSVVGWA